MPFSEPENPQKLPSPVDGSRPHLKRGSLELASKRHLDRLNGFCRAHLYAQHTDRQTMLRVTSVAIYRICAMRAMRSKYKM